MKTKKLLIGFLLLLLPLTCSGDWYSDAYEFMIAMPKFPAGMTYLAIYNDELLDADRFGGVPTSTFLAARDATHPATYFDSSGVMQKTETSNVGRFNHGEYDTSGFTAFTDGAGLLIESASTNLIVRTDGTASGSGLWTGWSLVEGVDSHTQTQVSITDLTSISSANSQRIQCTGVAADSDENLYLDSTTSGVGTVVNTNVVTVSCWARSQTGITGAATFRVGFKTRTNADAFITLYSDTPTLTTTWSRYSFTDTVTDATSNRVAASIGIHGAGLGAGVTNGATVDYEIWGIQVEISPHATSFIPTTTAALTRNAETNKYPTLGNRTAAVESCVVKLAPEYVNGVLTVFAAISDSDTKSRRFTFVSTGDGNDVEIKSNRTDSFDCNVSDIINNSWTANQEMTLGWAIQHSSPYIAGYFDGVPDGTNETVTDFTDPVWGTYFHIGNKADGTDQLNGTIFSIAFFDRVLSAAEMKFLHDKDWRTLR